jgi:hypothetical protein
VLCICLVGSSYGGFTALWGVIRNPERYAAPQALLVRPIGGVFKQAQSGELTISMAK